MIADAPNGEAKAKVPETKDKELDREKVRGIQVLC